MSKNNSILLLFLLIIAQALTEAAVRYASVVGLKIRPTCSFAKMFFTRHTQYKDMLVE